ncbi:MAG: hypothetical protein AAF211_31280, partial [Myxococcota bacterium]
MRSVVVTLALFTLAACDSEFEPPELPSIGPRLDNDGDGLTDREELSPQVASNRYLADTDGDGLNDFLEVRIYRSDPNLV